MPFCNWLRLTSAVHRGVEVLLQVGAEEGRQLRRAISTRNWTAS